MARPLPEIGELIADRYEVQSILGRGGMGVVFAAKHTISGRRVALKWMEPEPADEPGARERFLREARAMGRIEHPNVVGVLDVGTVGNAAYLVMEMLRGESLRSLIEREAPMPVERALALLLPAMEGVEAAHRAGVVHRDLKPENLFVAKLPDSGTVTKVLDFGISKVRDDESARSGSRKPENLTKTGHVVGTPQYMSPEQVRGGLVDARTDVWALGTILYEMLTGRMPFEAENYGGLLVAIATEAFTPLYQRIDAPPPALVVAVHRALEKDASARHASVVAFARALEPLAVGLTFREPSRPSLVPGPPIAHLAATVAPLPGSHFEEAKLEIEDVPRRSSTPTAAARPPAAKPAAMPLGVTVLARRAPPPGSGPHREARVPADDALELPQRGLSRGVLAAVGLVGLVVLAGAALALRGGDPPVVSPPVVSPPVVAPVVVAPTPPEPPVVLPPPVEPPPGLVEPPQPPAPLVGEHPTRSHPRVLPGRPPPTTPTIAAPSEPPIAPPPATVTPPSSPETPTSRSGSITRDDF